MTSIPSNPDDRVLQEIGNKLCTRRVELAFTQADLARRAGVSKPTVERLEGGKSVQTVNLVRVLRGLGLLERLELLLPKQRASPLAQLRGQKKPRQRVRKKRDEGAGGSKESWKWGE